MRIGGESMPLHEEIKSGQSKGKPRLERGPGAMGNFLQMTDATQHREYGLHQHPRIPQTSITQFEIRRITRFGMESGVTQDDHLLFIGLNQGMERGIGRIGSSTIPADHQAPLIEQQTELSPDNPAMIGFPFAADLLATAPFAHRVQQFNAIAIDHPQDRRGGQELVGPGPVGGQEPKQPRPLGQGGKQWPPIPVQPPIKGPIHDPFERKQHAQRHNFARPQGRQGMFGDVGHGVIYPIEHLADKVFRRHALSSLRCIGVAPRSLESAHDAFQDPLKLAPLVSTCRRS
jgi:hypothetical protein